MINYDKKFCFNCKHFVRHYMWWHDHFIVTDCGHCSEHKGKKFYKTFPRDSGCDKWHDNGEVLSERDKWIASEFKRMSRNIRDIALYIETLKED